MKLLKPILFLILFMSNKCFSYTEEYEIWGLWNLGFEEHAEISFGEYFRTNNFLFFNPEQCGYGPRINYEGGHYKIKEIISKDKNTITFFLEHQQTLIDERGELVTGIAYGKVIIYFIDNDHMWLELDYLDNIYPTDYQFSSGDFKGTDFIFWRASKIEYDK